MDGIAQFEQLRLYSGWPFSLNAITEITALETRKLDFCGILGNSQHRGAADRMDEGLLRR